MAKFTLGSSRQLGEEFSTAAAKILNEVKPGDTIYLDNVQDAGTVVELLARTGKNNGVNLLPSSADAGRPFPDIW
jgi:hypothetical protein